MFGLQIFDVNGIDISNFKTAFVIDKIKIIKGEHTKKYDVNTNLYYLEAALILSGAYVDKLDINNTTITYNANGVPINDYIIVFARGKS